MAVDHSQAWDCPCQDYPLRRTDFQRGTPNWHAAAPAKPVHSIRSSLDRSRTANSGASHRKRPRPYSRTNRGSGAGASKLEPGEAALRSEEHTSELQSPCNLVCRLLLEKKKHACNIVARLSTA